MMDGVDESFETIDESFETILFELTPLAEGPATYADPSPPQMSAVTLEQLAIKRVCAERLKNTTNKLKAKFDAQTKELTDAQAEAASWRKQYESQAAVKELNELKKAMERAAPPPRPPMRPSIVSRSSTVNSSLSSIGTGSTTPQARTAKCERMVSSGTECVTSTVY